MIGKEKTIEDKRSSKDGQQVNLKRRSEISLVGNFCIYVPGVSSQVYDFNRS